MDLGKLKITFSKHFHEDKVRLRGIDKEEVVSKIKSGKIVDIEDQGNEPKGHKYAVFFNKSKKHDLKVVMSIKGNRLNVITAHVQNIKRRRRYRKWLEKRR